MLKADVKWLLSGCCFFSLCMYAFAERFERDQHKPLLSPTALKLAASSGIW